MTMRLLAAVLVLLALLVVALDASGARSGKGQLWGAIAYSTKSGSYGYAVDLKSKRDAESSALQHCGADCDLIRPFRDACAAVASKPTRTSSGSGASREIAKAKAMKKCGSDCAVKVSACTSEK